MLALTHHSYLFSSNNLKLFLRALISKFHLKVEVPILELHVKTINQCNLGGDWDSEERADLNYACIDFGVYHTKL